MNPETRRVTGRVGAATSRLDAALTRLISVQRWCCKLLIVAMVLLISAEVVAREGFNHSLQATHELAGYLLVAVTFLSFGVSLHDRALFRVESLFRRLPPRGQAILQLLFDLLCLAFALVLEHQLIGLVASSHARGFREATMLATPLYLPQLAMPLGIGLMILVLTAQLLADARRLAVGGQAGSSWDGYQ